MSIVLSVITRWPSIYIDLVIRISDRDKHMRGFPRCTCAFDILARSDNTHASQFTRVYKELRFGDSRSWDTPVFVTTLVLVTRLGLVPAIGGFVPSQQSSPYRVPRLCAPQREAVDTSEHTW